MSNRPSARKAPNAWIVRAGAVLALASLGCTRGSGGGVGDPDGGTRNRHDAGSFVGTCDEAHATDTDGDGIYDTYEGNGDADADGMPNLSDTDADGDGVSDRDESGGRGGCDARDTDADGIPDFLDNDSDGDGLGDREERERYFTDPLATDTDMDGNDDLAEIVTMHDPRDRADRLADDDYYVVLPYETGPVNRQLRFGSRVRKADVFFMMDRTGSMQQEAEQLKSGLSSLVRTISTSIPDIGVGVGGFSDFPVSCASCCHTVPVLGRVCEPYGQEEDRPFTLISTITTDPAEMQSAVGRLEADLGGATWASSTEALYQTATGEGFAPWLDPQSCPSIPDELGRRRGYPCFRPGALPIIVVMTDTSSRNGPMTREEDNYNASDFSMFSMAPHTYGDTLGALGRLGARVFGVISGMEISNPTAAQQFRDWATMTGTVDAAGNPIFFMISANGSGLTARVADAIGQLATQTKQNVTTRVQDGVDFPEMSPGVDASRFVKASTPTRAFDEGGTELPPSALMRDDVTFYQVPPGTTLEFALRFENDFQAPLRVAQVFQAKIFVVGNGVADLDEHDVVIVVPAGSAPLI